MKKNVVLGLLYACLFSLMFILLFSNKPEEKKKVKQDIDSEFEAEIVSDFFLTANGDNERNAFYQNSIVFETPFMRLDYEKKHNLSDEEILSYGNLEWAKGVRNNDARPWMKIILRYTATITGDIPKSFDQYLEDEMNTLQRYLRLFKEEGIIFEMCEFGDEFNLKGIENLGFTRENVVDYYDQGLRVIQEEMPDCILVADIIPIYAFNEEVYSPGGGYDMLMMDRAPDSITFLNSLLEKGTPFSAVGIEIQPGGHTYYDIDYTKQFIEMITDLDLDIYIWELWILSEEVENMNDMERDIYLRNAPPFGYSEEWQAEVLEELLDFFVENGRIIGFNYMSDIHDGSFDPRYKTGLIREDGTYKEAYGIFIDWIIDMKIEPAFSE